MTNAELKNKIEAAIKAHSMLNEMESEYLYYGLRFEDADRQIGEVCGNSRHNPDREDEREFPEYGSADYEGMEELDGTSAWMIDASGWWVNSFKSFWMKDDADVAVMADHCYIIAGDAKKTHDDADENEIVIGGAVVIEKLF
jgi:hypothetical protein